MASVLWATTILLLVHAGHSYILLTANMDDVQAIARQLLSSPIADQIGKIWRRASAQFNQKLKEPKVQKRADEELDSDVEGQGSESRARSGYLSDSFKIRSRRVLDDLSQLSRNASGYLQSLGRVFEQFIKE